MPRSLRTARPRSARHSATRHPTRKPPAASHTDCTRPRHPAFYEAPRRLVTHHLHHDTYSHTAHNPLASAALLSVALGCLASPGALAAAAASLSAAATVLLWLTPRPVR